MCIYNFLFFICFQLFPSVILNNFVTPLTLFNVLLCWILVLVFFHSNSNLWTGVKLIIVIADTTIPTRRSQKQIKSSSSNFSVTYYNIVLCVFYLNIICGLVAEIIAIENLRKIIETPQKKNRNLSTNWLNWKIIVTVKHMFIIIVIDVIITLCLFLCCAIITLSQVSVMVLIALTCSTTPHLF